MSKLPAKYAYLMNDDMPLMVREAAKLVGTIELPGPANNPDIVKWADEVEDAMSTPYTRWAADWYNADSIPWCGLFVALVCVRSNPNKLANRMPVNKYLSALEWRNFGVKVAGPQDAVVGDIAVKTRKGGGHVAIIVGFTKIAGHVTKLHCLGGNQGDRVSIVEYDPSAFSDIRRVPYNVRPAGARQILVGSAGGNGAKES